MKLFNYLNFKDIYDSLKDTTLPFKTSYKLTKIFQKAEEESTFYNQELTKILSEYSESEADENGNIPIKKGSEKELENKLNELLSIEVEPCNIKLTMDELESLNFTISQLNTLMPFIEE